MAATTQVSVAVHPSSARYRPWRQPSSGRRLNQHFQSAVEAATAVVLERRLESEVVKKGKRGEDRRKMDGRELIEDKGHEDQAMERKSTERKWIFNC